MKQIIYTVLFLMAIGLTGCQKAEYLLFNDIARVQMDEANESLPAFTIWMQRSDVIRFT